MTGRPRVGVRLRQFREQRGLTQAALAQALGISPSYVNQMESNQRPITAPVLFKLADVYGVDVARFSAGAADRLVAELRDVAGDAAAGEPLSQAEIRELATTLPSVGRFLVELHRRYRYTLERAETVSSQIDQGPAPMAFEQVRDLFYRHRNHFPLLDAAAERIFAESGLTIGNTAAGLADRLRLRHGVTVEDLADESQGLKRRYDPDTRVLALAPNLSAGQRAFQLATHLALTELGDRIDAVIDTAELATPETRALARIGLANYAAGAVVLPYRPFLAAAERLRYDIDLLQQAFHVGFETVAHRLSTLQRRGARGVPFFFVRVDRAGNISKRQSATDFHFSRVGGTCPLWTVYEAFTQPERIHTQLAEMPDGRRYLWVARTVTHRHGGYREPIQTFAVGLGCDVRHAHRLVYGDGLDLTGGAYTPIGPGCKLCDRPACPQRAFPSVGKTLDVDPTRARYTPYAAAE